MLVRPLDTNGDILPAYDLAQMISGGEAVAQVINLRLKFFYGEWWEDPEMGFRIPEFLVNNVRRGDSELLAKYISAYIAATQDVKAVTNVITRYENHKVSFFCSVLTNEGEGATVEVNLDGLL